MLHKSFRLLAVLTVITVFGSLVTPVSAQMAPEQDLGSSLQAIDGQTGQTTSDAPRRHFQSRRPSPVLDGLSQNFPMNLGGGRVPGGLIGGHVPDLWIISARNCPQVDCLIFGKNPDPSGNCLEYYQYGPDRTLRRGTLAGFLGWLQPGVPLVTLAHGSFVDWKTAFLYSGKTDQWVKYAAAGKPVQFVMFTWPSDDCVTNLLFQIDIATLGRRASFNGLYLTQFLYQVPETTPVCLIGHSHGNRVVSSCLHLLGGGVVFDRWLIRPAPKRRLRAILTAAAIDHDWYNPGHRYERALYPVECVLNLKNSHDLALFPYPLRRPLSSRALASAGFTKADRRKLGWLNAKAHQYDVTDRIGHAHTWPFYYSDPVIARTVGPYLRFD